MKGDFSRKTDDRTKHYSGVLMQQGRVQLDADWNEQLAINQHRAQTEAADVIGPGAAPLTDGGFKIGFTDSFTDLSISPGRIYVDGILCEMEATSIPIPSSNFPPQGTSVTAPVWSVDEREFQPGQWVEFSASVGGNPVTKLLQIVSVDPANLILTFGVDIGQFHNADTSVGLRRITTYITQPDYPDPDHTSISTITQLPILDLNLPPNSIALVYLDVWQRHVTWLDDTHIREVALNGADTTTRIQVVQQVKILTVATKQGSTVTCSTQFPEWDKLVKPSTGTLNAQTTSLTTTSSVCLPPSSAGYQRLDNQLYRVEIHQGGDTGHNDPPISYKSSRDNGSVVVAIDSFNQSDIIVKEVGLDDVLGFANVDGQTIWGEIVDDVTELQGLPGQLVQIQHVEPLTRTITVAPKPTLVDSSLHPQLRRWDQVGTVTSNLQDLESGIQLQFSSGTYKTGDYWLIPARTTTGQIEWPQDSNGRSIPQSPLGITHHYCRLALLEPLAGAVPLWAVQDCRRSFPSLTSPLAMHIEQTNWTNDDFFTSDQLIGDGLKMTFDTIINPPLLSQGAICVSLEQPLEFNVIGSFYLTINGIAKVTGNTITWTWDNMDKGTLIQALLSIINTFQSLKIQRAPYMRVRVQGHAISTQQGNQSVYLDGQAFGQAGVRQDKTTNSTALTFPTGAGVAASDFESWFSLVPPPLQITTINFLDAKTQASVHTIKMPPAPTAPVILGDQSMQNVNAIEITFNRPIVPANLPQQITISYTAPFFFFAEAARPAAEAAVFPHGPVVGPLGGGGSNLVTGTVEVTNPNNTVVKFTIQTLPGGTAVTAFVAGIYTLKVPGTTNPPVIAQDNSVPLDGDFDFLPGGDFTLTIDVPFQFFFIPPFS